MSTTIDLLFEPGDDPRQILRKRLGEAAIVASVLATVAAAPDLTGQLADAITEFLKRPFSDLLIQGWQKLGAIRDAENWTRDRPGAQVPVALAEHTLTSTQRPRISVDVGGKKLELFDLILVVTVRLQAITLTVAQGEVVSYGAGNATSDTELDISTPDGHESHQLARREMPNLTLP
jgi:hypothetical protein